MREAIGNAFVLGLVVTFLIVLMLVFVGTMSYTKAFKLKNAIINYIDEQDGEISNGSNNGLRDDVNVNSAEDINNILASIGYQVRIDRNNANCNEKNVENVTMHQIFPTERRGGYDYCIYKYINASGDYYYGITTFMKFEFPVINQLIEFPVYGETKVYGKIN